MQDNIQKGGKAAVLGEIRKFGGRDYIKTASGWKFHGINKQPEAIRKNSGSKGYAIHPLDSKRNTHKQRAFEHEMAIYALKEELVKSIFNEESTKSQWRKEKELLTALGFKDKPLVVSNEEYDKIQGTELYTGLNTVFDNPESEEENKQILDQYLTQFREGDYHGSTSTHYSSEHGMNFTTDKDEAESYSKPQSEEDEGLYEGVLLKVKVKSDDFKVCSREKAEELSKQLSKRYNTYIPLTAAAALSGYNFSIEEADGDSHIVALNRGVLITTMKDNIQKGGKPAVIGERRKFGGKDYIKQSNGEWKPVAEGRQKQSKPADWSANTIEDKMKAAFKDSSNDPTTTANNKPTAWWKEMELPPLNGYPVGVPKEDVEIDLEGDIHSHAVMKWKDPKTGVIKRAYTKEFLDRNAQQKWSRISKLSAAKVAKIKEGSLKLMTSGRSEADQEAAAIVHIISQTGLRRGDKGKFNVTGNRGVSTLSPDNVTIDGDIVSFAFIGKSYKHNVATIQNSTLAEYLGKLKSQRKGEEFLFNTSDSHIDSVFDSVGGKGLKIKDLRTYIATDLATNLLFNDTSAPPPIPEGLSPTKQKKLIKDKLTHLYEAVSQKLNNTPAMAKNAYIHPKVTDAWIKSLNLSFDIKK